MDGIINFFKPRGMTSHDAVYFFRKLFNIKKVGHTGTLDPNATGVLPICIGKATRISEYLLGMDKEYIGELTLGASTDTQDSDGIVINSSEKEVSKENIINIFNKYQGNIIQIPPMYSALKHKGEKLYELARRGVTVNRPGRQVTINEIKILNNYKNTEIIFYTKCSSGTYIRTLCDDIGNDLGTFGYMSYLIRVGVGSFKIENSYGKSFLKTLNQEDLLKIIIPMDKAIDHLESIVVPDILYNKLINGVKLDVGEDYLIKLDKIFRIYCKNKFIGVGRILKNENNLYLKMDKVLI